MATTVTFEVVNPVIMENGVQVYPSVTPPEPGPEPGDKPVLVITSQGGSAEINTNVVIEGTIDLPNVACDILVDAGPTSFGTTKAAADGKWSKTILMNTTGMWTITAHATNTHGTTDSNSVIFQVSTGGVIPPPDGGGGGIDAPPEPVTRVNAGASIDALQNAVNAWTSGSLVLSAGGYNFGGRSLRLKNNIVLWADGICTINGAPGAGSAGAFDGSSLSGWTIAGNAPGQGFVLNGSMVNATSASNFVVACVIFNNQPSNGYDGSCVRLGSARNGVIVNCDFNNAQGNNLGMYSMSEINLDGGHFDGCRQPISYQFSTDGSNGNNMAVQRNTFERTTRACMEMGPDAQKQQKMNGLKVIGNWFDDFNPDQGTNDQGASLPISLVATGATNSTCTDNFVRRGDRPLAVARPHPAIEFSGSGECTRNTDDSFTWEGFMYSSGYNYHGNTAFNAPWGCTVGVGGGAGTIQPSTILSSAPPKPPKPTRIAQNTYYHWSATQMASAPITPTSTSAVRPHAVTETMEARQELARYMKRERGPYSGDHSDPLGHRRENREKRQRAERDHRHV